MLFTPVDDISEERWRTGPGTNLKTWRIPQCPLLMECSSAVLEQIRREVEAGRNLVRAERETGGVLFGIHEPGRICILACKALQCEHAMGPGFVLSEKDEKRLAQLISAPATDPELNGLEALGWFTENGTSLVTGLPVASRTMSSSAYSPGTRPLSGRVASSTPV